MTETLDGFKATVFIGRRSTNKLHFVVDIDLPTGFNQELAELTA